MDSITMHIVIAGFYHSYNLVFHQFSDGTIFYQEIRELISFYNLLFCNSINAYILSAWLRHSPDFLNDFLDLWSLEGY